MKYSVRLLNQNEQFHAYLQNGNKTSWTLKTAIKNAVEFVKAHPEGNFEFEIEDEFGKKMPHPFKSRLPLNDVTVEKGVITYHRSPTASEIKFGHGATHYADFNLEDCCEEYKGNFYPKKMLACPQDGLRYYR